MNKKKKVTEPKFIGKLKIKNYPSKTEILEIIDSYISSNELQKDYEAEEKSPLLILTFKDTILANCVLKHLQLKILDTPSLEKMTVNLKAEVSNAPEYKIKVPKSSYMDVPDKYKKVKKKYDLSISPNKKKKKPTKTEQSIYLLGDPYVDPLSINKRDNNKSKSLWISKKVFNNYAGNNNSVLKEINPYMGPGGNPDAYKFREIHKEKWKNGKNFYV
jgi:hypothetical protein